MIPKIIHFCWLSKDPYPAKIQKCINSWKENLPDYKIIKWDLDKFPLDKSIWVKEAFAEKKYAFAADYIRFYALYTEGGIYLDSDVEVLKPFDELLNLPYFLGRENTSDNIEAAVMGSSPNLDWVKRCLNYYDNRHFLNSPEQRNSKALPQVMQEILYSEFGIENVTNPASFNFNSSRIQIFPYYFFSPKSYITQKIQISSETFCIHHFTSAWRSKKDLFLNRIEGLLGKHFRTFFWLILRNPKLNINGFLRLIKEHKLWW